MVERCGSTAEVVARVPAKGHDVLGLIIVHFVPMLARFPYPNVLIVKTASCTLCNRQLSDRAQASAMVSACRASALPRQPWKTTRPIRVKQAGSLPHPAGGILCSASWTKQALGHALESTKARSTACAILWHVCPAKLGADNGRACKEWCRRWGWWRRRRRRGRWG